MNDKDALYWELRRENDEFLKRRQWWNYHFINGTLRSQRLRLAQEAEAKVAIYLQAQFGYQVNPTTYKCPFDLWVTDDWNRMARVEVKLSLYHQNGDKGGRFQANLRHHEADILIFIARNGRDWPFVIPMAVLGSRNNIAIWSYCPGDYTGQWAPYLDAWTYLDQALHSARPRARQISLPLRGMGNVVHQRPGCLHPAPPPFIGEPSSSPGGGSLLAPGGPTQKEGGQL